jgi:hypothetical protein
VPALPQAKTLTAYVLPFTPWSKEALHAHGVHMGDLNCVYAVGIGSGEPTRGRQLCMIC